MDKKVAILTLYDNNCTRYAQLSDITKQEYCKLHDFDYVCVQGNLAVGKHPVWGKILAVRKALDSYDIVIWVDADAIICNKNFDILPYLNTLHDFYISQDALGINAGVFAVKNTKIGKQLMLDTWNGYDVYDKYGFKLQLCIAELISKKYRDHICILPAKVWNSYDEGLYDPVLSESLYSLGDFILHLPNLYACNKKHPDYRIWRFNQILDKYYR